MPTRKNHPYRREARQEAARARQEAWEALTPEKQLAALDSRLGPGKGAVKQRAKILEKMTGVEVKPPEPAPRSTKSKKKEEKDD